MKNKALITTFAASVVLIAFNACGPDKNLTRGTVSFGNSCYDRSEIGDMCVEVCDNLWAINKNSEIYIYESENDCLNEINEVSVE